MHDLTHLDLFSGIGGFALAARAAGFRTVGFSEVEPYACRVLAERWPDVPNAGDVRKRAEFARFRGCTVLTGGFPCQPWSTAGLKRGAEDDRHLWPAMCNIIEEVWPAWIIGENVPGIVSVGLEFVCADLEALGYAAQPFIVPACAVDAWHRRDRVWIIAHRDGGRCEVVGESKHRSKPSARGNFSDGLRETGRRARQALADSVREGSSPRLTDPQGGKKGDSAIADHGGASVSEPHGERFQGQFEAWAKASPTDGPSNGRDCPWWQPEPDVGRVADGIPARTHRLKGLGNAIVPQVAERFLTFIAAIERGLT